MSIIKTSNSVKIERNTKYIKKPNGMCAKKQLWEDLPISDEWNTQGKPNNFFYTNSNFDKITMRSLNDTDYPDNGESNSFPNIAYLNGSTDTSKRPLTDEIYNDNIREAIFFFEKDSSDNTYYRFSGIYKCISYIKSKNLYTFVRIEDDLFCEW